MNTEAINAPSSNITLPLNQSVQQANGAQFALMLSLLYETKIEQASAATHFQSRVPSFSESNATIEQQAEPEFNLETSQTRALFNNQQAHFQLMHSLYAECSLPVDSIPAVNASMAEGVLQEINQGNASHRVTQEAERVRFSNAAQAA